MKKRADFENQELWLYYLSNSLGNPNMKICMSGRTKEGDIWFSKRYSLIELYSIEPNNKVYLNNSETRSVSRIEFINKATHRTILDIELVFDVDDEPILETAQKIMKRYEKEKPVCYFTGSKSYHIHIFKFELRDYQALQKARGNLLNKLNCDSGKGSSNNMIAIEGALHYKSGKPKIEVEI